MSEHSGGSCSNLVASLKAGTRLAEAADSIAGRENKVIIAARIGSEMVDLATVLERDAEVELLTFECPEAREVYRHTAAHTMAQAVKKLFPEARLGIGPAIEDGFYYDFDVGGKLTDEDLPRIEAVMAEIVKQDLPLVRSVMPREEAVDLFTRMGETYKVELLREITDARVTVYRQDGFTDLCRGPHLASTGLLRAFKLIGLAGAYWRGDETKPMLQRIYGTAFETEDELKAYLDRLEEAKRRDHRKLGTELDLYSIHEEAGAGLAYWHPKGAVIRSTIEDFWREEHRKRGYSLVYTPHIARAELWKASGHFDYYYDNMYVFDVDNEQYVLKPMNCVGHILIYKSRKRSYRDLPMRYAELGTVYRKERSGTLHGLMRVRGFTQDDAHIFCTRDQIVDEVVRVIDLAQFMLRTFGFKRYEIDLSVRDPQHTDQYAGRDDEWDQAEQSLAQALKAKELPFTRREGEAVFYGPKIDIKLLDALGRGWQGPTIQFDFNLPGRLGVEYVGQDGRTHNVVMIHRTVLGALGRFIGTVVEHYAGAMPVWLAPVQVSVLPVRDTDEAYAARVVDDLTRSGVRAELVGSHQKLGYRIRAKTMEKVPYILVVGAKEEESGSVSVRKRKVGDRGVVPLNEFIGIVRNEIETKAFED